MKLEKQLVIAIDGPAGAGKSTVAKLVAKRLGYIYIDTGAMYRALTLKALQEDIDLQSEVDLAELAQSTEIKFVKEGLEDRVVIDGVDKTEEIRANKVSNYVSIVAKVAAVREELVRIQRGLAQAGGVVMDGRDIGTVVLPQADLKIFLNATVEERTKRRYQELQQKEENVDFEQLKEEIIRRDELDRNRDIAPLKKADDAIEIDTTNFEVEEVVDKILEFCKL
ncbi:(d)CMP kinase [Natroniella sulfidigena]|uniref:(d)CMP kinase n=1 Tax=Natroniella sulfidigena TaxID=723921 RepID=UPI00200A0725|nr:(d)CMP kinase [Natroniella sulfidigena]MCK8816913.1 (d)CMP kinase [Natroniella sulfidigena]